MCKISNMSDLEDKEVSWKVLDIPIYGTVTRQKNNGNRRPVVVFVAGSGPTDRNWCSPLLPGTNGSAKLLAEALAGKGFITIRYDKMASGPHLKENLPKFSGKITMQTHIQELAGAVEAIMNEEGVDTDKIFVLTNSEGAIHAVNYQLQEKRKRFKGLVLTGAPGRSISDVARTQFLHQAKSIPGGDDLMRHYDEAIVDFIAGRPIVMGPSLPKSMEPFFRALENPNNLPFSRELWTYDLSEQLVKVSDPVLAVIGKKDIQVDWRLDGKPLERALTQNKKSLAVYPENANHVLKHEEMAREKLTPEYVGLQYNSDDAVLDKETTSVIFDWLAKQN